MIMAREVIEGTDMVEATMDGGESTVMKWEIYILYIYDRGYNNDYREDGGNRGDDQYKRQESHSRDHRQNDRNYRPQSGQKEEKKVRPLPEPDRSNAKPPCPGQTPGYPVASAPSPDPLTSSQP